MIGVSFLGSSVRCGMVEGNDEDKNMWLRTFLENVCAWRPLTVGLVLGSLFRVCQYLDLVDHASY
jgi:hypothetical protein